MKILDFPEVRQTYNWDCGAKAVQAVLIYYGFDVNEGDIIKLASTNSKKGTPVAGVKKTVKKYGLDYEARKMTIDDIKKYINKKRPVILLVQAWAEKKNTDWDKSWGNGHYVVAIGYDRKKIYFEDPSTTVRAQLSYEELQERWHDVDTNGKKYKNWGMVVFGKKPRFKRDKTVHMD